MVYGCKYPQIKADSLHFNIIFKNRKLSSVTFQPFSIFIPTYLRKGFFSMG
uniref:Uncharacterized protein n=1 Tax=Anguilla anguilla TaxID=7936 RepID=A0A0E9T8L6_ANGAN